MLFVPFLVFMRHTAPLTLGQRKSLSVRAKLVHFVFSRRDMPEVPIVHVQKAVALFERRVDVRNRLWSGLRELPVVHSG